MKRNTRNSGKPYISSGRRAISDSRRPYGRQPDFSAGGRVCVFSKGKSYTAEEDALIVHLNEIERLSWPCIAASFPNRTRMSLQVRYFTKLKEKQIKNRMKDIIQPKTDPAKVFGKESRRTSHNP